MTDMATAACMADHFEKIQKVRKLLQNYVLGQGVTDRN